MVRNLPLHWASFEMLDVIDYEGGSQPPKKDFIYEPKVGYVRLIQIRDYGDKPFPTYVPESRKLKYTAEDDIMIARYGGSAGNDSLGRICSGIKGAYNVALAKVIYPTAILPKSFVKYLLDGPWLKERLNSLSRSCQSGFNRDDLKDLALPLPPLNEQKRIIEKLDVILPKVKSARSRLEKIPAILKKFRQSVFAVACSGRLTEDWREGKLNSDDWKDVTLFDLISEGPQNGLYKHKDFYGSGTLIVRIDNFYDGYLNDWSGMKRLSLNQKELDTYRLNENDILINRVNSIDFLGKSALVRKLKEPAVYESNMMRFNVRQEIVDPEYLIKYLNSISGYQELRKNAKDAVNQSSINQDDVKAVAVTLPPLKEQHEIVRRVEKLFALADSLETKYKKAIERVEKIEQSILAKAFRGELVEPDPNDEPAEELLKRILAEKAKLEGGKKLNKKQVINRQTSIRRRR
jgi:type I restriction enzyme, S subunit